jgi:hypothetical protein
MNKIQMAKSSETVFLSAKITVMICARKHLDAECVIQYDSYLGILFFPQKCPNRPQIEFKGRAFHEISFFQLLIDLST